MGQETVVSTETKYEQSKETVEQVGIETVGDQERSWVAFGSVQE